MHASLWSINIIGKTLFITLNIISILKSHFHKNILMLFSRIKKSLSEWHRMGVSAKGFQQTPNLQASIVQPDGKSGRTFLTYPNYRVILKWNRSNFFAVAVGTLADRIGSP